MKQYDAIIIGFGKAGKTLAAELSNRGWQVAVVERSSMMYGGTCPNIACIPTKTLVHEAGIAALLYHDDYPKQANLYKQAIGRKNRLTSFLRNNNYERLSKRPNVTVYTGEGSFVSANIIKVALPEGDIELQGKEIFINTGSTPIIPAIDGIKESQKVYTSTTLLDLNVLPQHLIIVGGGYTRTGICFDVCRVREQSYPSRRRQPVHAPQRPGYSEQRERGVGKERDRDSSECPCTVYP